MVLRCGLGHFAEYRRIQVITIAEVALIDHNVTFTRIGNAHQCVSKMLYRLKPSARTVHAAQCQAHCGISADIAHIEPPGDHEQVITSRLVDPLDLQGRDKFLYDGFRIMHPGQAAVTIQIDDAVLEVLKIRLFHNGAIKM